MKMLSAVLGVILLVGVSVAWSYDWSCISECMRRGGLYQSCVDRCG